MTYPMLTAREQQVRELVCYGWGNARIGWELGGVAPNTVRSHIQSILRKLGFHSKGELAAHDWQQRVAELEDLVQRMAATVDEVAAARWMAELRDRHGSRTVSDDHAGQQLHE